MMKKTRRNQVIRFTSLCLCIFLTSCISVNLVKKTGVKELQFGGGGGFTGQEQLYVLTAEGQLISGDHVIKEVDFKTTEQLFKQAQKLKNYVYKDPGNVYGFLIITTVEGSNRIIWTARSQSLDPRVVELYHNLNLITH